MYNTVQQGLWLYSLSYIILMERRTCVIPSLFQILPQKWYHCIQCIESHHIKVNHLAHMGCTAIFLILTCHLFLILPPPAQVQTPQERITIIMPSESWWYQSETRVIRWGFVYSIHWSFMAISDTGGTRHLSIHHDNIHSPFPMSINKHPRNYNNCVAWWDARQQLMGVGVMEIHGWDSHSKLLLRSSRFTEHIWIG